MKLRVKSKYGSRIVDSVDEMADLGSFLELISEPSSLNQNSQLEVANIKRGFPPVSIDLSASTMSIGDHGIRNGEQLIVEFHITGQSDDVGKSSANGSRTNQSLDIPTVYLSDLKKYLILRNVPDDNSCMFNALAYALNGLESYKEDGILPPKYFRTIVGNYIKKNPDVYNEIVLGKSPEEYSTWIEKKNSWGGAIELGILASELNIRIDCLDIELGNIIKFENENNEPNMFIILIYSGIHYDLLALNSELSNDSFHKAKDETKWLIASSERENIISGAKELCALLQLKNYSTNTTKFRVRCLDCYKVLVGEMGASNHANETGHFNFGEVK
ncbi:uncharacterized protein PRCAT00000048001 [Priceomyces carsonii]|uniref:uncharacterized protein n=1 Tax=Priceomyces carsonii TaxID=28549 RepID=UPI002ED83436|nr:unnamed protein product [Priceomyces carsonii]